MWNPSAWPGVLAERLKIKGDSAMRVLSPGFWTCAALYVAIGLLGILFLASGPGVSTSSEGYGVAAIAAPVTLSYLSGRCALALAIGLVPSTTIARPVL